MIKNRKNGTRKLSPKLLLIVVLVCLVALAVSAFAYKRFRPNVTPTPTPTITELPAQPAANDGEKEPTANADRNSGTATDNQGQISSPVTTDPNQWTRSASGIVTVKSPAAGSTIKTGVELVGTAQSGKVQYRLLDDQVGVISKGFINVVSGNFSGNLSFQSRGSSGRLDVFTADDNGVESNEVQIVVKF
ncbi:MAG: hypothetical protein ABIQ89_02610 [Candidatus Saccharimonadales bacterium]